MSSPFPTVDSACVSGVGALQLPQSVCESLGVGPGDRVVFIARENGVLIANPAVYALETIQKEMEGEAARMGFQSEEDANAFVKEMRDAPNENLH